MNRKRNKNLIIQVNDKELSFINSKIKESGKSKADFIIDVFNNNELKVNIINFIDEEKEVKKISYLINEIVKLYNITGEIDKQSFQSLRILINKVFIIINKAIFKIENN